MRLDPAVALPSRPSPGVAGARLGELYAEHSRLVYGICRMLLRDANEAEDATQQVFLAAYRNLLEGTEVRDSSAWLGTIARNACRRRATARMREPLPVADEPTLVSLGVDEQAMGREEAAALYAELAALPEKQREALVLRELYGMRYDEVAAALGTSRASVEALLFRGRRRLQRQLRPRLAAGVLVVPLALRESIAYAVPGFASTAVPAGAAATAAGVPLLAKLAAAGAAVGIAGSAGVVAERTLHDPPVRPTATVVEHGTLVERAQRKAAQTVFSLPEPPRAGAPEADDDDPRQSVADEDGGHEVGERGEESEDREERDGFETAGREHEDEEADEARPEADDRSSSHAERGDDEEEDEEGEEATVNEPEKSESGDGTEEAESEEEN